MYAVKIAMRANAKDSNNPKDIEYIFLSLDDNSTIKYNVIELYDILMVKRDKRIYVGNSSSYLIPTRAIDGTIYIRSTPNKSIIDELMKLPRC